MIKAISWVLLFKVIAAFLGFISVTIITRYAVSTEEAGFYFFMVSLVTVLATIARVGCDNVVTRFIAIANKKTNKNELLATYQFLLNRTLRFAIGFSILFLSISLIAFYYQLLSYKHVISFALATVLLPFINASVVFVHCFQGIKSIYVYALLNGLSRIVLVILLLVVVLVIPVLNFNYLSAIYGLSIIITAMISYWLWHRNSHPLNESTVLTRKKEIIASSYTLWGVAVLATIMTNGAPLILGFFSSPDQVAIFAATSRVALILSFILIAINSVLSPQFAELSSEVHLESTRVKLQMIYRKSTSLMVLVTLPLLLFVFFFAKPILLIFGEAYEVGSQTLQLLLLGLFYKVLVGSVGQLLVMTGYEKQQRLSLIVAVAILIIQLAWLTPIYGAFGAAISVLIAMIINNSMGYYFVYKKLNITLFNLR